MVTLTNSVHMREVVLPGGKWWFCLVVNDGSAWWLMMVLPGGSGSGPVVTVGSSGSGNDGNILWLVFTVSVAGLVLLGAARPLCGFGYSK